MASQEDKEIQELLTELGLALVQAQTLEFSMVTLFAATELKDKGNSDVHYLHQLMDTRYTQTLGKLLREAARSLQLEQNLIHDLEKALRERNWLVHHFYHEYAPAAFHAQLRNRATVKVRAIRENLAMVSELVYAEAINRLIAAGMPDEELEAGARKATEDYIAEKLKE